MIGLTNLDYYISFFKKTPENSTFKVHEVSVLMKKGGVYESTRSDVETNLGISDIAPQDRLDKTIRHLPLKHMEKYIWKKNYVGSFISLLARYESSIYQEFEKFPKTEVDLLEDDISLELDEFKSNSINNETPPGI